jgi:prophage regulatory protein
MARKKKKSILQARLPFILRKNQLAEMLGVCTATIDTRKREGLFPQPVKLGTHAIGWLTADVQRWLKERADERQVY